jgi:hypothetical protein
MSVLKYIESAKVSDVKRTNTPKSGQTISGYGGKIPTANMIKYDARWHRVYVMLYSNSGTAYIIKNGENLIIDVDTYCRIQDSK